MRKMFRCFCACLLVFVSVFAVGFFMADETALAEAFTTEERTLEKSDMGMLSVSMSANPRNDVVLQRVEETGNDLLGVEVTYLVFQWSELDSLVFDFSIGKGDYSYSFAVDYVQSETILPSISTADQEPTLIPTTAALSRDQEVTFTFYIDSDAADSDGATVASGYGFGLYRFRISYTCPSEDNEDDFEDCEYIYVAVFPDDIDSIVIPSTLELSYSIASSNSILNAYTFSLSGTVFEYCNPEYFVWIVEGEDVNYVHYCYNKTMQKMDGYELFACIKSSEGLPTGTTFFFDTDGLEGTWVVTLNVQNAEGDVLGTYSTTVSTIKGGSSSSWWVILVCVFGGIVLLGLICFIPVFLKKKKEGVW